MNLLAHALLADPTPDSILGNVGADFIRPPDVDGLSPTVHAGVMRHRKVDAFTDSHPTVMRSIHRLSARWGWFAGILVDVYYDHILTAAWPGYVDVPLRAFIDRVYEAMRRGDETVPEYATGVLRGFAAEDRFWRYRSLDGIEETLARLSDRIAARMPKRAVRLEGAMPDLRREHDGLTAEFHEFFPQLVRIVNPAAGQFGPAADPWLISTPRRG